MTTINVMLDKDGELQRKQLWLAAWMTVAGCENCVSIASARNWADGCLAAFDETFTEKSV